MKRKNDLNGELELLRSGNISLKLVCIRGESRYVVFQGRRKLFADGSSDYPLEKYNELVKG